MQVVFEAVIDAIKTLFVTKKDASLKRKVKYLIALPEIGIVGGISLYKNGFHSVEEKRCVELVLIPIERVNYWQDEIARIARVLNEIEETETPLNELNLGSLLGCKRPPFSPRMLEDEQRRVAVWQQTFARFPVVEKKMLEVYGLRLPKHVAAFSAFWNSLDETELAAMGYLDLQPAGIMVWFEDDGLKRLPQNGLDPRLHDRYRRDPAELVTIMKNSSGGHYGLWFDDPAELPAFIAFNNANKRAETFQRGMTIFRTLKNLLVSKMADSDQDAPFFALRRLEDALDWFEERVFMLDDLTEAPLASERAFIIGGIVSKTSKRDGNRMIHQTLRRNETYHKEPEMVHLLVNKAFELLERGSPAYALTLGRELHWLDTAWSRGFAQDLLIAAYNAMDRHALAGIVKAHYAHREFGSIQVY